MSNRLPRDIRRFAPLIGLWLTAACAPATLPDTDGTADESIDLQAWFKDYNAGLGQDYLETDLTPLTGGDASDETFPEHTFYRDIAYGPLERNRLNLWLAPSDTPTPLAIYIHGGGFRQGDKSNIYLDNNIGPLLKQGVSVASINYRWAHMDRDLALASEQPNGAGNEHDVDGARLDYILRDCARAVQFLRYQGGLLNLDDSRFGVWGPSAGGGCSLWIGTVPDLALPDHQDPVLRASSRVLAMGHLNSQVTYNSARWPYLLNLDPDFVWSLLTEDERLAQMTRYDQHNTELGLQLLEVLDFYAWFSPDDPSLFAQNNTEDSDETTIESEDQIIHHPRGAVALYERCLELGLDCEVQTPIITSDFEGGITHFLAEQLAAEE